MMGINSVVKGGDHRIIKPVARNNERMPFLKACEEVAARHKWPGTPPAGAVVILAYEDGTVTAAAMGISMEEAKAAIRSSKGYNPDVLPFLQACETVLLQGRFLRPVAGVVVLVVYRDGSVDAGAVGLDQADMVRAVDAAKDMTSDAT